MLKYVFFTLSLLTLSYAVKAQKVGYFDSKFVLEKLPEYKQAQQELSKLTEKWRNEVNQKFGEVEKLKRDYQAEEILLTEDIKKERQDTIFAREKAAMEYKKKVFGFDGMLFLKRQELMKPLQDKVFEAVEQVSKEKRLAIMFDKSSDLVMIYTDPRHDYTDYILEELGLGDPDDQIDNDKYKKNKKR